MTVGRLLASGQEAQFLYAWLSDRVDQKSSHWLYRNVPVFKKFDWLNKEDEKAVKTFVRRLKAWETYEKGPVR